MKVDELDRYGDMVQRLRTCYDCDLGNTCMKRVLSDGSLTSKVMLIGEAPGFHEDIEGKPFVGPAGRHLNAMLWEAGIARSQLYITNTVKCKPPDNKTPTFSQRHACEQYINNEIELIKPYIIVPAGGTALDYTRRYIPYKISSITHVRGRPIFTNNGTLIFPVFHPSYCLRETNATLTTINDFKVLKCFIDSSSWIVVINKYREIHGYS